MSELKTLVHLRGQAKAKVTRIRKTIDEVIEAGIVQLTLAQLKVYSRNLEAHFQEYLKLHHQITALLPPEKIDDNDATYLQFEKQHIETCSLVEALIEDAMPKPQVPVAVPVAQSVNSQPPQIVVQQQPLPVPIPSFDGKPENWPRFQQIFSDVMSRSRDSNAVKLHHLERALSGGCAAKIIDPKTLSDGDFDHAWELLLDVYEDERKAVDSHIQGLLSLKRMSKECSKQLRELLNEVTRHVEGLKLLKQNLEGVSERFVIVVLSGALDPETRKQWEATIPHKEIPKYDATIQFLKKRCSLLERCEASQPKPSKDSSLKPSPKPLPARSLTMATSVANGEVTCDLCSASHPNYKCDRFVSLTVPQRRVKVRELNLCFNCLRKGHIVSKCPSSKSCQECHGRHNTLLHDPKNSKPIDSFKPLESPKPIESPKPKHESSPVVSSPPVTSPVENVASFSNSIHKVPSPDGTLLLTAMVDVLDNLGNSHPCRAFLDCGSQPHLVSRSLIERLEIEEVPTHVEVYGATGKRSVLDKKVILSFRSRCTNYQTQIECLVTEVVTGPIPCKKLNVGSWNIPSGLALADPSFHVPGPVDLLIGVKLFFHLMLPGQLVLGAGLPILKETRLGWIAAGGAEDIDQDQYCCAATLRPLTESMERFWSVESIDDKDATSKEDQECEELFSSTTVRNPGGTYTVRLPLRESVCELQSNRTLALKRFHILEHRLNRNPELKLAYTEFINEYKSLSHCKEISESDDNPGYYLPHHAIFKPSSSTTRLRVVFDASARTSGPSLNDVLKTGPIVQDEIFSIILRFRRYCYALTADLSKMFRRIAIALDQTRFQRIFWREHAGDPLQILELSTVTYGTACATFLATRTLLQLARDERQHFPAASKVVEEDVYVDDVVTGADTIEEAVNLREELTNLFNAGGFPVHKWCASDPAIIEAIPEEDREKFLKFEDSDINKVIKTLGLLWDPDEDIFRFHCGLKMNSSPVSTKRNVLSEIARIFDPLGLIAPTIVLAKEIMQRLWKDGLDWDDSLDGDVLQSWLTFRDSLKFIDTIKIPRFVGLVDAKYVEVHGFADASNRAYGAVVYLRIVSDTDVKISLLCSKSRIAPLKPLTIPKMELSAALLLSKLVPKCISSLKMDIHRVCLWSDSRIVLAWLEKSPSQLEIFVRNRVTEINTATEGYSWHYVRSEENPADVVSRGQLPQFLSVNDLWWQGPPFLKMRQCEFSALDPLPESEIPEVCPSIPVVAASIVPQDVPFLEAFSSFRKLQRVVGYVLRFVNNCRSKREDRVWSAHLTVPELRKSMIIVIGLVQRLEIQDEIDLISSGKPSRRFAALNPIVKDGLVRVGGRLEYSHLPYESRHQVILPSKSPVCELLIRDMHLENLHLGPSALFSLLRQKFWLINAKSTIRKVLRKCVQCFRFRPRFVQPLMGSLPEARVVPSAPFSHTGVDFAGPVLVKVGLRKTVQTKAYICIFICLATKAIHLELVSDLSSAAFVAALQRFVSRRGFVEQIHSDNGTNFAGAKSDLHELYLMFRDDQANGKINEFCTAREIQWKFIPPRSPNFGGLWEAGVKSIKTHLRKILSNASLNFEEFYTVLTQIEAVLNSRPLFASPSEAEEPSAITPGHFLIGRELIAIPEPTLNEIPMNHLTRWKYLQSLREHFWKRWSAEYLHTLQTRSKWRKDSCNVVPGLIVLLKEDNLPPQSWKLGKILNVYPGKDSVVRVVDVKTSSGVYRRPVSKIAPLPIEENDKALATTDSHHLPGGVCSVPNV